jgi:CheY-like chemotaxis protein
LARKILLADDSVTAQNMGRKILADAGYEIVTVNNGSAALKKIAELKPDLVILDVYMPGYSGLEVCQRLKESPESARIPVLLTVGKLEPFKPEEAQRVRAEGFIVKPFEASELLAALSKLEDKVVPRAEPSKPGRFARAIAAAEEAGRISRNDSPSEDNGWKNRISFPHEKTAEEKVADEAPVSNPVTRDLHTVVETPAEKAPQNRRASDKKREDQPKEDQPQEVQPQTADTTVDVGALASPGLPQDVTPEEVAAIAAAAAQIRIAEALPAEAGEKSEESQDVPMTMAAATEPMVGESSAIESMSAANGTTARWSAVAVALDAEEAKVSLDQEMQKAYAAFVAEETPAANGVAVPDVAPPENSSAPVETSGERETPTDAISGEISNPNPEPAPASQPEHFTPAEAPETAAQPDVQSNTASDSFAAAEPANIPELEAAAVSQPEAASTVPISAEPAWTPAQPETSGFAEPTSESVAEPVSAASADGSVPQEVPTAAESEPAVVEASASSHAFAPIVFAPNAFAPIVHGQPAEEIEEEPQGSEPVDVKTTAAAWASWRQIRDTGDSKPATVEPSREEFEVPASVPDESAAMAVAAGAEQTAQEAAAPSTENSTDVASIVDSVLADLRPRLMAEITRKMAEKK